MPSTAGRRPPRQRRQPDADVYGITTARRGQRDDVSIRMRRYAISMGIRMVCLVLAFVLHGPVSWVFVAGAILLPYVAVLLANAGRESAPAPQTLVAPGSTHATPAPASAPRVTATRPALPAAPPGGTRYQQSTGPRGTGQHGTGQQGTWQHSYRPPSDPGPHRRAS